MYSVYMSSIQTLYVRDRALWKRARKAAGSQGLSSFVERAIRQYLDRQEPMPNERAQKFVLSVKPEGDGEEMTEHIEFQGQLMVDSKGFSLEQIPRIRIYRTEKGRLVLYRSYPFPGMSPLYTVYSDFESLARDKPALDTMWITEHDMYGDQTDLTPKFLVALKSALRHATGRLVDQIEPSQLIPESVQSVRLGRDDDTLRRSLHGFLDLDVLLIAMLLLSATESEPTHLSEIYRAFGNIKPLSRLGNTADSLGDLPAAVRGYLNADARLPPARRLFNNPKRGSWGVSSLGERRANDVLRHLKMKCG